MNKYYCLMIDEQLSGNGIFKRLELSSLLEVEELVKNCELWQSYDVVIFDNVLHISRYWIDLTTYWEIYHLED